MFTKMLRFAAVSAAALSLASAGLAEPELPLNAGHDGFKSNAGGGNGCEGMPVGDPEVVVTESYEYSYYDVPLGGDPVFLHADAPAHTEGTPVWKGAASSTQTGRSDAGNFKRWYTTEYWDSTTSYYSVTSTIEHHTVTKVYLTTTTTQHMAEIDPGNSTEHNRAKECTVPDVVTVDGPNFDHEIDEITGISEEYSEYSETVQTGHGFIESSITCNSGNNFCGTGKTWQNGGR